MLMIKGLHFILFAVFFFSTGCSVVTHYAPEFQHPAIQILIFVLAVFLWFYFLKREVKRRTDFLINEIKEKEKATNKLKEDERDFKKLVENIHDCVFSMNEKTVVTYISPNVEKITGYRADEIINTSFAPFFAEEQREELFLRFKTRIETGIDDNAVTEIRHKDGSRKWVSASTKIFTDPEKGILIQGTFRDVTDTVIAQQALHHSEERFRKLTESSPVGIYIVKQNRYSYVNPAFAKMFGAEPSEMIGNQIDLSFIHPEDVNILLDDIQKLVSGKVEKTDHLFRAFDRFKNPIYIHFYSTIIDVNEQKMFFGTALEVTDRVNTRKALEEQEERFRTLSEKSFTGLVLAQDGLIQYINPRYLEIIGYSRSEIQTTDDLFNLTHPDDIESVRKSVEDRENGLIDHVHYQCRMFHKKGHVVYLDIYGSVVSVNGKNTMMASIMDISNIVGARNKLEKSVHEKNILLAEIHHRVKNNMAVVSGLMELQKFKTDDDVVKGLLKESQLRIKTIAMIHEKLYQSDSFAEIPFGEYISDLIQNISQSLYSKSNEIKIIEDYDNMLLNINQAIPAALFTNEVITNCFKHAFPNGKAGEVSVSLKKLDEELVSIRIADNGIGLPENKELVGKSLGMTLIKNLSNQINAELSITNDNGCCFEIRFKKTGKSDTSDPVLN